VARGIRVEERLQEEEEEDMHRIEIQLLHRSFQPLIPLAIISIVFHTQNTGG
jgi:uncharacterized membrane protein (DUF106 family)